VERRIQALAAVTDEDAAAIAPDPLIPADVDPTGGMLTITDARGTTIATLKITGPDLARYLEGAPLEPQGTSDPQ